MQEFWNAERLGSRSGSLGDIPAQVYTQTKRSIPDLRVPEALSQSAPAVIHFDSLQTMPLSFDWLPASASFPAETSDTRLQVDTAAVEAAATWLRAKLQLRLFGFDVVVDKVSGAIVTPLLRLCDPTASSRH